MSDIRHISEYYTGLAAQVIKEHPADFPYISRITVIYLESEHKKAASGRAVLGQCEKVADKYLWAIPADFTITVFAPNVEGMSEDQLKILLYHELLHIGAEEDGEELRLFIKPHDLEDFKAVIDEYGTDWDEVA